MDESWLKSLLVSFTESPYVISLPESEFTPYLILGHMNSDEQGVFIGSYLNFDPPITLTQRLRRGPSASQHALSLLLDVYPSSKIISRRWFAGQSYQLAYGSLYVCIGGAKRDICTAYIQLWTKFLKSQKMI